MALRALSRLGVPSVAIPGEGVPAAGVFSSGWSCGDVPFELRSYIMFYRLMDTQKIESLKVMFSVFKFSVLGGPHTN